MFSVVCACESLPRGRHHAVADLGGRARHAPPPTAQNVLNFMQFFTKFGKIICWRPPGELAPHPTGNPGSAPAM